MVRTQKALITTALVVFAVGATACSESVKPQAKKTTDSKQPVGTTFTSSEAAPVDAPAPAVVTPASFADGEYAYQAGNYAEASRVFALYTEKHPDNAWGHFMLGLSSWKGGDLARAESSFEEALKIDPNHVKSLVNSSRVLLDQKRTDEAIEKLNRAADVDPMNGDVHRLLGRAFHAKGQIDDAVDAYRRAIEIDPKDSWAMNNLGLLFIEQGRSEEAVPLLARAVELKDNVAAFQNNLGMALEHTGRFTASKTAYSNALAADPNYEKARRNLARVEQVKVGKEEPFELEATAQPTAEETDKTVRSDAK